MKIITSLFLVLVLTTSARAQKEETSDATYVSTHQCNSLFPKESLSSEISEQTAAAYLVKKLPNLFSPQTGLVLQYYRESPGAFHYSFCQTYQGIKIYQSEVKINIDRGGVVRSVFDNSKLTNQWPLDFPNKDEKILFLAEGEEQPKLVTQTVEDNHYEVLRDANGDVVYRRDMAMYFAAPDSMVSAKVFNPDPLTSLQQPYGTPYVDNNDSNAIWLDAQQITVNMLCDFNNGVFRLESPFVKVKDISSPTIAPVTSTTPQFYFNRSESGFEDVNAFYHISQMHNHIASLGFNCADSLVEVDPHGFSADNSVYSPSFPRPQIQYGTGGVDDAEDADVVVHEYGHHISNTASPGSNIGSQRNGLDEGFGDYLAASYSNAVNNYNNLWVFNWDGHNEYWNGRVVNTTRMYPVDLSSTNIYRNGEMWSTMLFALLVEIGRDATDSLILQTHYSYSASINMEDAAQLLIDADTLLTNGHYACSIYRNLYNRGFVSSVPAMCSVGIQEAKADEMKFMQAGNSFSVLNPNGVKLRWSLYSVTGQLITTGTFAQPRFDYNNQNISSGVYIVSLQTENNSYSYKWCKP